MLTTYVWNVKLNRRAHEALSFHVLKRLKALVGIHNVVINIILWSQFATKRLHGGKIQIPHSNNGCGAIRDFQLARPWSGVFESFWANYIPLRAMLRHLTSQLELNILFNLVNISPSSSSIRNTFILTTSTTLIHYSFTCLPDREVSTTLVNISLSTTSIPTNSIRSISTPLIHYSFTCLYTETIAPYQHECRRI